MKSFLLTFLLSLIIMGFNQLNAQETAPAENAAPQATENAAQETAPAENAVPNATDDASKTAQPEPTALAKEKESLEKLPAVKEGLSNLKEFKRRLPNYYRSLNISKDQVNNIYKIQKEYFEIMVLLQARLERLEAERDAAVLNILTEEQKTILKQKTEEAKKIRDDKKKPNESEE